MTTKPKQTEPKRKFRVVGTRPIRHDGWDKVRAGVTTVEEVLRVSKA